MILFHRVIILPKFANLLRDDAELSAATDPNFPLKITTTNSIKDKTNNEFNLRISKVYIDNNLENL